MLIIALTFATGLRAQQVWPGDVNNNGVVNGVDLLFWGVANGSTGPARLDSTKTWAGQAAPLPWNQSFANALNYYYADTDGNGKVEEDDIDAIRNNYGLTHGMVLGGDYNAPGPSAGPRLRLIPEVEVVGEGAQIDVELVLDDMDAPLQNFYGIAFTLRYSPELLSEQGGLDFRLVDESWVAENEEDNVEYIFIQNPEQGTAEIAITRTNQEGVAVDPFSFGNLSIVIEDIILGLDVDTFAMKIDSIRLVDQNFSSTQVASDSLGIIVAKDPNRVITTSHEHIRPGLRVYPNPARDQFYLETPEPLLHLELIAVDGRRIPLSAREISGTRFAVSLPDLPLGMYWLKGTDRQGVWSKKLILLE